MITLQMPAIPDPVPVTLKAASTAVLVFDVIEPISASQPKCLKTMVPAISGLLARARKAGITVGYGTRAPNMSKWLPEVAPAAGDVTFVSYAQDRFFNTDLDKTLKAKGVTTLILTGWKISGSVLYTSVGATLRDYTVVIPVDASLGPNDYEEVIGLYQIFGDEAFGLVLMLLVPALVHLDEGVPLTRLELAADHRCPHVPSPVLAVISLIIIGVQHQTSKASACLSF